MLTISHGERLTMRLACELWGTYIGNPDLNRTQALGAKALAVVANPVNDRHGSSSAWHQCSRYM